MMRVNRLAHQEEKVMERGHKASEYHKLSSWPNWCGDITE